MLTNWLIKLGLIATPYFIIAGRDIRDIKLDVAGVFALAIGLSTIYSHGLKPQKNKWLMFFIWAACSSYLIAPACPVSMYGIDITLFWVWKPMYYFIVFGLMIFSVSSIEFTYVRIQSLLRWMSWCGFVMACYTILQYFKLDQIFQTCTDGTYGHMAGFIGNPTHVSPYIAMIIPICLYLRRRIMTVVMVVAVCLTTSSVAIIAMGVSILCYFVFQTKKLRRNILLIVLGMCVLGAVWTYLPTELAIKVKDTGIISDNQRFLYWGQALNDLRIPQLEGSKQIFPLTGMGLGTYKYLFHFQHQNSFFQAHNEYVELTYNLGLIGLGLFFGAIAMFFKRNFNIKDKLRMALFASFICVAITAGGAFIWQIGTTAWYTCLVVGLLSNDSLGGKA